MNMAVTSATAAAAGGTALYHIAKASRESGIASVAIRALIETIRRLDATL